MATDKVVAGTATAAQVLLGAGLEAALEARRKAWFGSLDEALAGLAGRVEGFEPGRLAEDEAFISTVATATRIAVETHGAAKLEALRNVVLNAAASVTVDDVTEATFMGLLGRLSDLHIRLLRTLANPLASPEIAALESGWLNTNLEHVLRMAFLPVAPAYAVQAAVKGLETDGLLWPAHKIATAILTENGPTVACLNPHGVRFLAFISAPATMQ